MRQKTLLSTILLFFSVCLFAQDSLSVNGIIKDEQKQPLAGATIMVPGTQMGTVTGEDGKFTLKVPAGTKSLIVSYIGYDNRTIELKPGQTSYDLNINMAGSEIALNQVVVSVSKRREKIIDAPASITVIGQEKLQENVVTTPVDELKGIAGVDIMRTGLVSSNVVVRGFNDIFSTTLLNVVDDRIGSVPSLRVNAYQLVPTSDLDYDKIEVVRGPASALYGPNATSGAVVIMTKNPLDQDKKFETTVSMQSGFLAVDKILQPYNGNKRITGNIINPEIRHSGKLFNGKFGYKISGSYFQGQDYPNYDPREPYAGDSLVFGTVHNGQLFTPDTLGYTRVYDSTSRKYDTLTKLDIRRFNKNFNVQRWSADAGIFIKPTNDILINFNGGISSSHNIELTGLGAGVTGGDNGGWIYWYFQTKFKWKNLFIQYFINASDAGGTYLIPQLSASGRYTYNSTSPPTPYAVQLLVDKSKLHVVEIQHSWAPIEKLHFVYGFDAQLTRPNSEGTIYGLYEPIDKVNIAGLYLQGTYDPLKWLTIVGAIRGDYNSLIKNVAASPRGALVFKVAENQSIRLTYNRAFDQPNTLDDFLDLAQAAIISPSIPLYGRGIGNPNGWNYNYASNGTVEFRTNPWGGAANSGTWVPYGSTVNNVQMFDSIMSFMTNTFVKSGGGAVTPGEASAIVQSIFRGISGSTGTVANAAMVALNLNNFGSTNNYSGSIIQNPTDIHNIKKVNNQYTGTLELGYKGLLFHKLSVELDGFWTRITNWVSPLTPASEGVSFNNSFLGPYNSSGQLYKNLYANDSALNKLLVPLLDGSRSLQNGTITAPMSGTVWDEITVLVSQLPVGMITPNSSYVNSDYILTYVNQGNLNLFGVDLGLQYAVFETNRHMIQLGGTFDWMSQDHFVLGP